MEIYSGCDSDPKLAEFNRRVDDIYIRLKEREQNGAKLPEHLYMKVHKGHVDAITQVCPSHSLVFLTIIHSGSEKKKNTHTNRMIS